MQWDFGPEQDMSDDKNGVSNEAGTSSADGPNLHPQLPPKDKPLYSLHLPHNPARSLAAAYEALRAISPCEQIGSLTEALGASGIYSPNGLFPSAMPTGSTRPLIAPLSQELLSILERDAKTQNLEKELAELKRTYMDADARNRDLRQQTEEAKKLGGQQLQRVVEAKTAAEKEAEGLRAQLVKLDRLKHISGKVEPGALELLGNSEEFLELFSGPQCMAFVVSIDLRRSTTLMLKARDPQLYAMFVQHLCDRLYSTVLENHGVFDKFTGDGVLAFFPDFFSGADAGYWAVCTASICHAVFREEYRKHRNCFSSVLGDVGLGIGIDFGCVTLVPLWGGLTVVGAPVVYACRMGAAPAGSTLLNQPAYEQVLENYSAYCRLRETSLEVKGEGEGPTVAYEVELGAKSYNAQTPDWPALIQKYSKASSPPESKTSEPKKMETLPIVPSED